MTQQVPNAYPYFTDQNGKALDLGFVYIGAANQDPVANPIAVYWDDAKTIAATQPLRTAQGYIYRSGSPANVYPATDGAFSIRVTDRNGRVMPISSPSVQGFDRGLRADIAAPGGSDLVGFEQSGTGSVVRTVKDKLRENVTAADKGAPTGSDDTSAIQNALNTTSGIAHLKNTTYKVSGTVYVYGAKSLIGENAASTIIEFSGTGDGLSVDGTNGTEISRINLKGSKASGLILLNNAALFNLHNLVSQNNQSPVVRMTGLCQDAQINGFDFLQCGGVSPASAKDGSVMYYGPTVNNVHTFYGRFEAPRNTASYVDGAQSIHYIGGKIDGSFGGSELTTNPFVVVENGDISFSDYTVTGFKSYPFEIIGHGQIDYSGVIGNGLAPAIFKATAAAYLPYLSTGGVPGVILKPNIKARCSVAFSSTNTSTNLIDAVISLKAPNPLMLPNAGNNGVVQITSAFDTGGGLIQAAFKEWNGSAFVAPSNNDKYTGGWLVDFSTGNAFAQITTQVGGLCQFRGNGLSASGTDYFIQYDSVHGVRVDIEIDAAGYSQKRFTAQLAEVHATVTTTATSYSSSTGLTTVQLSASVTNDTLTGYFLFDAAKDDYYYISGNAGTQLTVMHDRTTKIVNATYKIVKGNPKAGKGIAINWN